MKNCILFLYSKITTEKYFPLIHFTCCFSSERHLLSLFFQQIMSRFTANLAFQLFQVF